MKNEIDKIQVKNLIGQFNTVRILPTTQAISYSF